MPAVPSLPPARPRPVADVPGADPAAVTKGWLLALMAAARLDEVAAIPVAELAAEAPALCAAVLVALGSDAELERLCAGRDRAALAARCGALAGAAEPGAVVAAVEALRAAVWQELGARDDADLAGRLAHVCAVIAQTALAAAAPRGPYAVLAVEIDDHERLLAAEGEGAGALGAAETAVQEALRPAEQLVRLGEGRFRVTAAGAGAAAARALAARIAEAVAAAAAPHGVPLTASIGVALSPEDGVDDDALVAKADSGLFAARASGVGRLR